MSEKEKLLDNLIKKSSKTEEEIEKLIENKLNELSGLISEEGAIYIIANDLGIRLDNENIKKTADYVKIDDIKEPKTPVSFECKVIRKYDKVTFSSNNNEGQVQSILVGDETGIVRVVFWHEKTSILENIQDGDILRIINAYTRENLRNERIEIHYGQYSDIEVNPQGLKIQVKEYKNLDLDFTEKKIEDLEENDKNVKISGLITDFDIPRFYLGCPECFKKVFQDEEIYKCAEHDEVIPKKIPIINAIIDDGTGTLTIVGFRDRAEQLCKMDSQAIISLSQDIEKYRSFSKQLIGSSIIIGGNIGLSNMTGEKQLIVNQVIDIKLKDVDETLKNKNSASDKKKSKNEKEEEDFDIEEIEIEDL